MPTVENVGTKVVNMLKYTDKAHIDTIFEDIDTKSIKNITYKLICTHQQDITGKFYRPILYVQTMRSMNDDILIINKAMYLSSGESRSGLGLHGYWLPTTGIKVDDDTIRIMKPEDPYIRKYEYGVFAVSDETDMLLKYGRLIDFGTARLSKYLKEQLTPINDEIVLTIDNYHTLCNVEGQTMC